MVENKHDQILLLLKKELPGFENKIELVFRYDPIFREIASEYYEIAMKLEMNYQKTGKIMKSYSDTSDELKEELMDYLNNLKSDNLMFS
jgi:hypothetical protein